MTVQHECELILAVNDAEQLRRATQSAIWQGLTLRFQSNTRLTDFYWDTPDYDLTRAGWAIRLRVSGKEAQLQAKSLHASDAAGVNLREEFHQRGRVNFNGILATLDVGPVSLLIAELLGKPVLDIELTPLFAAARMRRTYKILANPMAFLMLDSGAIHRASALTPQLGKELTSFFRIELEGDPSARAQLLQWAQGLADEIGVEITSVSKFELGWQTVNLPEELLALAHAAASRHPVPEITAAAETADQDAADQDAVTAATADADPATEAVDATGQPVGGRLKGSAAEAVAAAMRAAEAAEQAEREAGEKRIARRTRAAAVAAKPARLAADAEPDADAAPEEPDRSPTAADATIATPADDRAEDPADDAHEDVEDDEGDEDRDDDADDTDNPDADSTAAIRLHRADAGSAAPVGVGGVGVTDLPPVIAHADLGGSLVVTAEPIDRVLDDACHDPMTGELRPLEEWPLEFRENCLRREASEGAEFISHLGHLLRQSPAPESAADILMRHAGALFDITQALHRLEPRYRPLFLAGAHLAGSDLPGIGRGARRWVLLRDRIVYHGLPDFSGRLCWLLGLAVGSLNRAHRDPQAAIWRRLAYEERCDALRLGALLKLARDLQRKGGNDWVAAHLDLRHGRPVLLIEAVGTERKLPLKGTGGFWRATFGEPLPLKRRGKNDLPYKTAPKIKLRPIDRKRPIDIFCGQNTGAAIAEILARQEAVFVRQEQQLHEVRSAEPSLELERFRADPLIEIIHDYRVALRRLRSYCRLFELPLGRKPIRKMTAPMQTLAAQTAALRQVDVLIETIFRDSQAGCFRIAGGGGGGDAAALFTWLLQCRNGILNKFWQQFDRSQTAGLIAKMRAQLRPERWCWVAQFGAARPRLPGDKQDFNPARQGAVGRSRRAQQTPIEIFAAGALMQSLSEAQVLYQAARPDPLHCPSGDLHAVRIGLKKFRYGFELFAPLMGDATNAAIAIGKRLQDQLGDINDCEANCHMLQALLHSEPPPHEKEGASRGAMPVRQAADLWTAYSRKRIHDTRLHLVETWPRLFGRSTVEQLMADWWV